MSPALSCPACHATLDAVASHVGDEIPCPKCAVAVPVPATLVPMTAVMGVPGATPSVPSWTVEEGSPLEADEKLFGMLAHLLAVLMSFFVGPLFGFIPPLILLTLKGKDSRFVAHNARESLNYQIMIGVLSLLFGTTFAVLLVAGVVGLFTVESKPLLIGYFAILGGAGLISVLLELYSLFMVTLACIKSYHGEWFRYPHCVRLVR